MESFHRSFTALGGPNELVVIHSSEPAARRILDEMEGETRRIEGAFSRYTVGGIVARINGAAGSADAVPVNDECANLLNFAATLFDQSEGRFDITSGVLRRVWSFRPPVRVPTPEEVAEVLPLIGWGRVSWDGRAICLPLAGMEIDLGGVGKEYAVDRLAGIALSHGVRAMINCAGDVRVTGVKADESPWNIGVQHPRDSQKIVAAVRLVEGSVATSGDYQRFVEVEGRRYSHLLNPRTGFPVESFRSVSVVAQSCMVAGSAATLAMLYGEEEGIAFLEEIALPYLTVSSEGALRRGGANAARVFVT